MKNLLVLIFLLIQLPAFSGTTYTNSPKPGLWGSCRLAVSRKLRSPSLKLQSISFFEEYGSDSLINLLHNALKTTLESTRRSSDSKDLNPQVVNLTHTSKNTLELSLAANHDVSISFLFLTKLLNYLTFEFAYLSADKSDSHLVRFYETVQAISVSHKPENYYRAISQFAPLSFELVHKSQIPRDIQEALNKINNPSKGDYKGSILAGKMDNFKSADVWGSSLMELNDHVEGFSILERDYTFMELRIKSDNPKFISFLVKKLNSQLALVKVN